MVQGGINIVDTNGINTELLHECSVTKTTGGIAQRVTLGGGTERVRTAWLIAGKRQLRFLMLWHILDNSRNTNDLEAITGDIVDEAGALDLDVLYGSGKGCAEQEPCTYGVERLVESVMESRGFAGW